MNRRLLGVFGVAAGFTFMIGACKGDPLSDLNGKPATLVTSFTHMEIPLGDTVRITASVVDGRMAPLTDPVTFRPCNAEVVTTDDPTYKPIPATSSATRVATLRASPSCIVATGAGFEDTVTTAGVPIVFEGTVSPTTPKGGDTVTINSTTDLKFKTTGMAVSFGAGASAGTVVSSTVNQLKVLAPFSPPGTLTITGVQIVTYTPARTITLPTTTSVTQTGDFWPAGDEDYATAPDLPLPAAAGATRRMITNFGADNKTKCLGNTVVSPADTVKYTGPCVIYKFTLAAPTDLTFSATWNTSGNVDLYTCGSAGLSACPEGAGRTLRSPEAISKTTYAAGTHYLVIELYSGVKPTNVYLTITQPAP